jgi:hypothetical protein
MQRAPVRTRHVTLIDQLLEQLKVLSGSSRHRTAPIRAKPEAPATWREHAMSLHERSLKVGLTPRAIWSGQPSAEVPIQGGVRLARS